MVVEGLVGLMRQASVALLFSDFLVERKKVEISLLQFIDDTLVFFAQATMENVR